jgi:prolyl-tRNA synthetase
MHSDMLNKARAEMLEKRKVVTEWRDFTRALDSRCTALAPHCEDKACEKDIKNRTAEAAIDEEEQITDGETGVEKLTGAAKSLCIPFEQPDLKDGQTCVGCNQPAKNWTLFGRSY